MSEETTVDVNQEIADAEKVASDVQMIPLGSIVTSKIALRPAQEQSEQFLMLVDSIRKRGVLQSVLVREVKLPGGVIQYGLIDGLQRYTAATQAGVEHIPARVVSADDGEVLELQIIANMNRVDTKPAQLAGHFVRMLGRNPLWTLDDLANRVSQSKKWVEDRLSLNKLLPEIQTMVDDGKIKLSNAYVLAKLDKEEQVNFVADAQSQEPKEFIPRVKQRQKELAEAKRAGTKAGKAEFQPVQTPRKLGELKSAYAAYVEGKSCELHTILADITDPVEAAKMTLAWCLTYDPASQQRQREDNASRVAAAKEAAERRKKEREQKKQEDAARDAADITKF